MPARASASWYAAMRVNSASSGLAPASELTVALTMIM
jgi:hypothetical protein